MTKVKLDIDLMIEEEGVEIIQWVNDQAETIESFDLLEKLKEDTELNFVCNAEGIRSLDKGYIDRFEKIRDNFLEVVEYLDTLLEEAQ